nr:pentatricopeptide repeat-containing protein At2g17140 [Ipomoea batatas]
MVLRFAFPSAVLLFRSPRRTTFSSSPILLDARPFSGFARRSDARRHDGPPASLYSLAPDAPQPITLRQLEKLITLEELITLGREVVSIMLHCIDMAMTYTFNLLISGLCDYGRLQDARKLFDKMSDKRCEPNEYTFGILIRGYCLSGIACEGLELLDLMKKMGLCPNVIVYNTLISTFCKEGKVPEASRIFMDMQVDEEYGLPRPNIITFNVMLEGFCKEGMLEEAKSLVESMKKLGLFSDVRSYNIWLLGLMRNAKMLEAQSLLTEMVDKGIEPSIYSYNIVIDGLCKNGMVADAGLLMGLLKFTGISPDTVTYTTLLHAYCIKGKVNEANNILNDMMNSGCTPNTYTCNTLLHSLWKEGKVSEAEKLLQKMNERGYPLDSVSCNIMIDGISKTGKVDKAVEIIGEMWTHGSAALGNLGNLFLGLVDGGNDRKKCLPDLITYSTIINSLCKDGRLGEAKKKFVEMMERKLFPDSIVYNTILHHLCNKGKIAYAFQVLKDMEKKGCKKSLQTYNSLILVLGSKKQIFEMSGLMDEMRERGIFPNVYTYNIMIQCLCEEGRSEEATILLEEMLQKGTLPNTYTFELLIKTYCRIGEFRPAQELFEISLSICGHRETLYRIMFNELLAGGEIMEAKLLFEAALDRCFDVGGFLYKDLIDRLCKGDNLEIARDVLKRMMGSGYGFDPASFMPVIDGLRRMGNKRESNELADHMLEMVSTGKVGSKAYQNYMELNHEKQNKYGTTDWQKIVHRDDGSAIAMRSLKRVLNGWGQGILKLVFLSQLLFDWKSVKAADSCNNFGGHVIEAQWRQY